MNIWNGLSNFFKKPNQYLIGGTWDDVFSSRKGYLAYKTNKDKLSLVLENPAMLKVAVLLADIFSLAKIEAPNELQRLLKHPNAFQTKRQFLWDYMFWNVMGNVYIYPESRETIEQNIYILNSASVYFPQDILKDADKLLRSSKNINNLRKKSIEYYYKDGTHKKIPLKDLIIFNDMTNSTGNWFEGASKLDALYKIISNSEIAIDAKHDNIDFTRRFSVSGQVKADNIHELPMGDAEKDSIETAIFKKKIHATKTPVNISRFTDNIKKLALDESYMNDLFIIGNMYGIPKDVLETLGNGTWDNQSVARASLVEFSLQAKGEDFIERFAEHYGYDVEKDEITISWAHLSFNQVFENQRADRDKKNAETMDKLVQMGAEPTQIAERFGFKDIKFKKPKDD